MAIANKKYSNQRMKDNPTQANAGDHTDPVATSGVNPTHSTLKIPDLIAMLQLSASMVYKMVERGEIPHYRIGTAIRFDQAEIREWLRHYHRPARISPLEMLPSPSGESMMEAPV